jgi:hypothetical protein
MKAYAEIRHYYQERRRKGQSRVMALKGALDDYW